MLMINKSFYDLVIFFNLFFCLIWISANYKAVQCLSLTTLNCERSSILLKHFLESGEGDFQLYLQPFYFFVNVKSFWMNYFFLFSSDTSAGFKNGAHSPLLGKLAEIDKYQVIIWACKIRF